MVDHHWLVYKKDEEFVPNLDKFGFVYLITNLHSGKGYIGCKQYKLYNKLKERESDWKTYTGSSKWLNEDIKKIGKEHFKFEIIAEYKNRRSLRYYELYYQMKFNVLSSTIEGTDEPAYYNSRVGGKFYRPVESYEDPEYRKKMSEVIKKKYEDPEYRKKHGENIKNSEAYQKAMEDPEYIKKNRIQLVRDRNTKRDPVTGRFIKRNVQAQEK
tara:strand:+ start:337 stop:975 length:639 start_codon:yes stop_codon:yes gene_type:complete